MTTSNNGNTILEVSFENNEPLYDIEGVNGGLVTCIENCGIKEMLLPIDTVVSVKIYTRVVAECFSEMLALAKSKKIYMSVGNGDEHTSLIKEMTHDPVDIVDYLDSVRLSELEVIMDTVVFAKYVKTKEMTLKKVLEYYED